MRQGFSNVLHVNYEYIPCDTVPELEDLKKLRNTQASDMTASLTFSCTCSCIGSYFGKADQSKTLAR